MSQGKGSGWAFGFFADARPRNDKCRSTRDHPTISRTFRAAAIRSVAHAVRSLRRGGARSSDTVRTVLPIGQYVPKSIIS